jgi:LysR family hydrogen peroxide-inducible transcriptional activator
MNLRDLRYLVALADQRHFGRAAEACFVSQPTLSMQIKKLEAELDVTLVERTPRRVLLTEAGLAVAERARAILHEVAEIRELARQRHDPEAGTVRLGLFPTLGPYLLPHVVPAIRARFPRLELLLVEEKTEQILKSLREGRLDAGVLALPLNDPQIHCEFLFEEPFLLAVPPDHRLAGRHLLKLSDIADESLLLLEEGHCLREQALDVCRLAGASEKDGFRATSLETLRQMVAAHVGVTLMPSLSVQPPVPRSEALRLLPFRDHGPSRKIAMVWRKRSAMAGFLGKLAATLRELPPALLDARAAAAATEPAPASEQRHTSRHRVRGSGRRKR